MSKTALKPKPIPIEFIIPKEAAKRRLKKINESIVLAYESTMREKDKRQILKRLFEEKRKMVAVLNPIEPER